MIRTHIIKMRTFQIFTIKQLKILVPIIEINNKMLIIYLKITAGSIYLIPHRSNILILTVRTFSVKEKSA